MNKFFWTIFLFVLSLQLSAQDSDFKNINGVLTAANSEVSGIHIINKTSRLATITNQGGYFSIRAKLRDTLLVSGVGFRTKQLVVDSDIYNNFSITIDLETDVFALNEVVVMPYNLTGELDLDMEAMKVEDQISEFTLNLPNAHVTPLRKSQRLLHEATTGGGIVPLNPILNGISGRTKKLKKIVALDLRNQRTLKVRYYYPDSLFVNNLKIEKDKILDFMYYCETDPEFNYFAELKDKFKLWELMIEKSKQYRDLNSMN
jgi:hypothetical protein